MALDEEARFTEDDRTQSWRGHTSCFRHLLGGSTLGRRGKLGPAADLRVGMRERTLAQAMETEEGEEEEVRRGKKMAAPRKREQAATGPTSAPKKAEAYFCEVSISPPSTLFDIAEHAC